MPTRRKIDVGYLARVEGETAIEVRVPAPRGGETVRLRIFEPPRFFEGFLVGRRYDEVGDIVSRICGICPVSHMLTAIRALENAMGIEPSEQTRRLRLIETTSQVAASHLVHLYALVMPDHLSLAGFPEMLPAHGEHVARLLRMREAVNDLTALVGGGRPLHPIGTVVGGFTRVPPAAELAGARERLIAIRPDARELVRTVARFQTPQLERDREFVALRPAERYSDNVGIVASTAGLAVAESEYRTAIGEEQVPYAMTKRATLRGRGAMMVGALARMNLNADRLSAPARDAAGEAGLALPDRNPFHNNLAQAVEVVQAVEDCIELLEGLSPRPERPAVQPAAGEGAAATEAPRGLLYHSYAVNRKGVVERADIATPTVHNFLSMEEDLRALVALLEDRPAAEIRLACEMLVRAYDPCFSCSVH